MKKIFIKVLIVFVLVYLFFGLYLYIYQTNFVYFPSQQNFDNCPNFSESQKININGTRAYFENISDKLIVFYHGNAGSTCDRYYLKNKFKKQGFSYLFVEYTGYSNDIKKTTKDWLIKDVENMEDFLKTTDFKEIIIMGESLGTALATYHSSIRKIDKLLLVSPFDRLAEIAQNNFGIYPIKLILKENYNNGNTIKKSMASKVQIIHGNIDNVIPIEQARKLFNKIEITNKKFVEIKGASHNDIYNFEETDKNINIFLTE
jgi:hypothetical protein